MNSNHDLLNQPFALSATSRKRHSFTVFLHFDYFFVKMNTYVWLKIGLTGFQSLAFSAVVWWVWLHRNLMCLNNEVWSLIRLTFNIKNSMVIHRTSLHHISLTNCVDKVWNGIAVIIPVIFLTSMGVVMAILCKLDLVVFLGTMMVFSSLVSPDLLLIHLIFFLLNSLPFLMVYAWLELWESLVLCATPTPSILLALSTDLPWSVMSMPLSFKI